MGVLATLGVCAFVWSEFGKSLPYGGLFPYGENMLTPWGAYAGSAVSHELVVGNRPLLLGENVRLMLTVLGCVAGAGLAARGLDRLRSGWQPGRSREIGIIKQPVKGSGAKR